MSATNHSARQTPAAASTSNTAAFEAKRVAARETLDILEEISVLLVRDPFIQMFSSDPPRGPF